MSVRFALTLLAAASVAAGGCNAGRAGRPDAVEGVSAPPPAAEDAVARGRYLVEIAACADCHTPMRMGPGGPENDMSQFMAGHPAALKMPEAPKLTDPWVYAGSATNTAFAGPWGISYAINLTPDEETGIGAWSEQVFVNALKTGRHMGVGRPVLPPMPVKWYSKLKDEDVKAIFAYLKSLPPKKNQVPEAVVAPPAPAAPTPAAVQ